MGRCTTAMWWLLRDQKSKPKLIRVTSSNEGLKHTVCASILLTITNSWTKFGTEHKYCTINTPVWPNSHKLKIQDGGGRHLGCRKNVNNFGLDKDRPILYQIIWEDASRPCGDEHVTKSPNRKLIRVTSLLWWIKMYILNEFREHVFCAFMFLLLLLLTLMTK